MSAIVTVPFHGHSLITIEQNGKHYAAMKPIVEAMGLQWEAQLKRIQRNTVLSEGMSMMDTPSNGGVQKMVFIPLDYLNGWLFGIDANRVKPAIRETVIAYQRECYQALHDYWTKGVAVNPNAVAEQLRELQAAVVMLSQPLANTLSKDDALNLRCMLNNAEHIYTAWREELHPALTALGSPLARTLHDRIKDMCFAGAQLARLIK